MNKQFIQVTNGLLPVTVLLLLAVAFIAGQARAKIPVEAIDIESAGAADSTTLVFSAEALKRAETLPHIMEVLMQLPTNAELRISLLESATGRPASRKPGGLAK